HGLITPVSSGSTPLANNSYGIDWSKGRTQTVYFTNYTTPNVEFNYTGTSSPSQWASTYRVVFEVNEGEEVDLEPREATLSLTESSDTLSSNATQFVLSQTARGQGTHNSSSNNFTLSSTGNFSTGSLASIAIAIDNSATSGLAHGGFT